MLRLGWSMVNWSLCFNCIVFIRYCLLGSQCDMFEYKVASGNDQCRYFPHLQLKDKRWLDFLQPVDDVHQTVSLCYTVNCSRTGAQDVVMSVHVSIFP